MDNKMASFSDIQVGDVIVYIVSTYRDGDFSGGKRTYRVTVTEVTDVESGRFTGINLNTGKSHNGVLSYALAWERFTA